MPEVRIDGVLYVPVSEAHISARAIEDAIVGQWWGEGWRDRAPRAIEYLRVLVTDTAAEGDGSSVAEFVARILAAIEGSSHDPE